MVSDWPGIPPIVKQHHPDQTDPNGLDQHERGAKLDAEKPRVDLIFDLMPRALLEVARVASYGAEKYTDDGWLHVPDGYGRYTAAMDRHRLQGSFSPCDDESGMLHDAHLAWNALARLELYLREQDEPDG